MATGKTGSHNSGGTRSGRGRSDPFVKRPPEIDTATQRAVSQGLAGSFSEKCSDLAENCATIARCKDVFVFIS